VREAAWNVGIDDDRAALSRRLIACRRQTEMLAAPLSAEDQMVQSMPEASPTKWHRAHTTWFFESFVLVPHLPAYRIFDPRFGYLFNSYYEALGPRHPRFERGLLSRPGIAEIAAYRRHVDGGLERLLREASRSRFAAFAPLIELGLHHEQQHQELLLMDVKHALSLNPLRPPYRPRQHLPPREEGRLNWVELGGALYEIGHEGEGFAFDNEEPRHRIWNDDFALATRLVTCGEYQNFIEDGGYRQPSLWLAEGWALVEARGWQAPLYWEGENIFTLQGMKPLDPSEPVSHVSFYEADAYARWAGHRLPREGEWEIAAVSQRVPLTGNLMVDEIYHPRPPLPGPGLLQMIGDLWEWTASPYVAYPGFRPAAGAIGEYNGKFMSNQMVLRGGAAVTPGDHLRLTYRNFFPPDARWVFTGIRLAR